MTIPDDPSPSSEVEEALRAALALHRRGALDEAEDAYRAVLGRRPQHPDARHLLGVIAFQRGRHEESVKWIDGAIAIDPKRAVYFSNRGNALRRLKRSEEALASYERAIDLDPGFSAAHHNRGLALNDLGRFEEAVASFDTAIALEPGHALAYSNRGNALKELQRFDEALASFDAAVAIDPAFAESHYNRGNALRSLRRFEEAVACYERAIALRPSLVEAHYNRAVSLGDLGRYEEALAGYDRTIELDPGRADAHYNRGASLQRLSRPEEALASFDAAIALKPGFAEAHCNRGNVLKGWGRFEEAMDCYAQAIALKPAFADAHYNRGVVFAEQQRLDEALASYDRAIEISHDLAVAHNNRGETLKALMRLDEALASYDRAIALRPGYGDALCNRSLVLLMQGKYREGWALYEWRWKRRSAPLAARVFAQPLWLGAEDVAGKTVLLHAEQGLGDTIQFVRYAKLVQRCGAKVLLDVPEALVPLMAGVEGVDALVRKGRPLPHFDFHCPLLSLPLAFGTELSSIPAEVPYLGVSEERKARWRRHLGAEGFRIAICWQGNPDGKVDIGRSFPVRSFEGIARIPGVRLISLQKNAGTEQLRDLPAGMRVETLPEDFDAGDGAFLDSAAVMACVDLVITSDTALTHLAGACGVRTWLPLKHVPDWRWMLERSDSPWYPQHRLFRQRRRDDWSAVFAEMESALPDLVAGGSSILRRG
jgi:tetratricopeptide (TPR) repeat protein